MTIVCIHPYIRHTCDNHVSISTYLDIHVKIGAKRFQMLSVTNTWEVASPCNFIIKYFLRDSIRETPLLCPCPDFFKLFSPIPPEAKYAVLSKAISRQHRIPC